MNILSFLIIRVFDILLTVLEYLMLIRAVLSWIPTMSGNVITDFVYSVTEIVIGPVRKFLSRTGLVGSLPIDLSFMATYLLLILLHSILPNF
ncbi:MAG: YggT family protein [Clostridia bacterium]|nr:YggT family protein [Clostridia bacterium]